MVGRGQRFPLPLGFRYQTQAVFVSKESWSIHSSFAFLPERGREDRSLRRKGCFPICSQASLGLRCVGSYGTKQSPVFANTSCSFITRFRAPCPRAACSNCRPPCALEMCKTSRTTSDLSPERTNGSLCWEDGEEMPLSSFSQLRRMLKSDISSPGVSFPLPPPETSFPRHTVPCLASCNPAGCSN